MPQNKVNRAEVLQQLKDGVPKNVISEEQGTSRQNIYFWERKFLAQGLLPAQIIIKGGKSSAQDFQRSLLVLENASLRLDNGCLHEDWGAVKQARDDLQKSLSSLSILHNTYSALVHCI